MVLVDVDIAQEVDDAKVVADSNQYFTTEISGVSYFDLRYARYDTGTDPNNEKTGGTRGFYLFKGITIPMNSTIDDATLTLPLVHEEQGNGFTGSVRGILQATPTLPASNVSQNTAGTVWFKPVGTAVKTFTVPANFGYTGGSPSEPTDVPIDIKDVIQELVNNFNYSNDQLMLRVGGKEIPTTIIDNRGTIEFSGAFEMNEPTSTVNLTINFTNAQICVPTSDISNAGVWEDTTFGNSDTDLFDELDETVSLTDDDTSAVKSPEDPQPADTFEVKLDPCIDPLLSTDHKIKIRVRGSSVKIQLYQGAGLIAESGVFTPTSQAYETFEYTLSGGEADSITDYDDLRIRVVPQ